MTRPLHAYRLGMKISGTWSQCAAGLVNQVRFDDAQKQYVMQHLAPAESDGLEQARLDAGFWPGGAEP